MKTRNGYVTRDIGSQTLGGGVCKSEGSEAEVCLDVRGRARRSSMAGAEEEMNPCRLQWGGWKGRWVGKSGPCRALEVQGFLDFIWEATEEFQKGIT